MKKEKGWEASYCQNIVSDRGDGCLFNFLWARRLFCNVFPFPVSKAELIGDWYENRRGAPNTFIFLIFRQYYWRTEAPCANRSGGLNKKIKLLAHCVWSALPIGGGGHQCANIQVGPMSPAPLLLADRTQKMYRNDRILCSMPYKKRRTEQYGALRLFSSKSPIYLALQTGNGNRLKKR